MILDEVENLRKSLEEFDSKKQKIVNSKKFKFYNFLSSFGFSLFRSKNLDVKTIYKKNGGIINNILLLMTFSLLVKFFMSCFMLLKGKEFGFGLIYMFSFYIIYLFIFSFSLSFISETSVHKKIKMENKKSILKAKKALENDYSNINILEYLLYSKKNNKFLESESEILYYGINNIEKKDNERFFISLTKKLFKCYEKKLISFYELTLKLNEYIEKLNIEKIEILEDIKKTLKLYLEKLEKEKSLKKKINEFSEIKTINTLSKTKNEISEINKNKINF
tara:strand:- start:27101 stop:27934 length:834 start_codon:yes stop_codon:yes gene_type:complete